MEDILIPYDELIKKLQDALENHGFEKERAYHCSKLFAQADLDGVRSHGVNRFSVFLDYVKAGWVKPNNEPKALSRLGMFERWDGEFGPGNLNAAFAMDRAISLSREFGIGCIALQNTNHWMRAGNFGWQAVDAGCIGICFTNTKQNMAAWGGSEPKLGNNPLVIAVPRAKGPVILDMAMSQFAYGKMSIAKAKGNQMEFDAGFDGEGKLSRDPALIMDNELALPIGLWKGSGLSLMIDLLSTLLSGGNSSAQVEVSGAETGLSQVFISLDPEKLELLDWMEEKTDLILENLLSSKVFEGKEIRYPGQFTLDTRKANVKNGVLVSKQVWVRILKMSEE